MSKSSTGVHCNCRESEPTNDTANVDTSAGVSVAPTIVLVFDV